MVKRIGGFRRRTRDKLKKDLNKKGKISLRSYLQKFAVGDRVNLALEPSVHKGMYNPRFHALTGKVSGQAGGCYKVLINDQGKEKTLVVHPVHLKRL
jgi:large subunit ribosomal protein L21e